MNVDALSRVEIQTNETFNSNEFLDNFNEELATPDDDNGSMYNNARDNETNPPQPNNYDPLQPRNTTLLSDEIPTHQKQRQLMNLPPIIRILQRPKYLITAVMLQYSISMNWSHRPTMRRASILRAQISEPLIVVEDEEDDSQEREQAGHEAASRQSSEEEGGGLMNPYLLSPFAREMRKQSLPTPQCSGITASQVRRLSERGETAGPGPRQAEFLATLSTAAQPSSGGRRHSVVTISRMPPTMFGRARRDSVAAFAGASGVATPGRILPGRRESIACPPSTEPRGSVHNLQLDIMDDIVQARKVRMKLWNTSSEKVCEVQPLEEGATVQRYTNSSGRRFSDFVGTTLAPIPSISKRRASELPPIPSTSTKGAKKPLSGIVCSNTDLISILTSLSASATEISQCEREVPEKSGGDGLLQKKRSQLKSSRSNSFDVSVLQAKPSERDPKPVTPSNWLAKRHQPAEKEGSPPPPPPPSKGKGVVEKEPSKVMWDERSGSLVDPHALGSAIEVFLRKTSPEAAPDQGQGQAAEKGDKGVAGRAKAWFSKGDGDSAEACESSICSTLKDLFVK